MASIEMFHYPISAILPLNSFIGYVWHNLLSMLVPISCKVDYCFPVHQIIFLLTMHSTNINKNRMFLIVVVIWSTYKFSSFCIPIFFSYSTVANHDFNQRQQMTYVVVAGWCEVYWKSINLFDLRILLRNRFYHCFYHLLVVVHNLHLVTQLVLRMLLSLSILQSC